VEGARASNDGHRGQVDAVLDGGDLRHKDVKISNAPRQVSPSGGGQCNGEHVRSSC
jgi:hypothetical protein